MKKIIIYFIMVSAIFELFAQNDIQVGRKKSTDYFDWKQIDTVEFKGETQFIKLKYSVSDIDSITFSVKDDIDLSSADKATDGNQLTRVYLTSEANKDKVLTLIEGVKDGNSFSLFVPYLTDFSSLVLSFESTGSVYANAELQKSGVSAQDLSTDLTYKVVSDDGKINTYTVHVYNSGLPVVSIVSTQLSSVNSEWSSAEMEIKESKGNSNFYGVTELKFKGGKYSTSLKRSYNLKLSKKKTLLQMSEGKRWELISNDDDETLLRSQLGFLIGQNWSNLSWTPRYKPVELIVDGIHKGSYLLCEQPRLASTRVDADYLLEVTDDPDASDNCFTSKICSINFKMEDPDDAESTELKTIIDGFETALFGTNFKNEQNGYRSYIDVNSFVDWYLINELAKNSEAAFNTNCFLSINANKIISMGPVGVCEDFFGNKEDGYEGYVLRTEKWINRMFEDPYFVNLVVNRFSELQTQYESLASELSDKQSELTYSYYANEELWNVFGNSGKTDALKQVSYSNSVNELKTWLKQRMDWLSFVLTNEAKIAKNDNLTNDNQITSFQLKKSVNSNSLLQDYTATIAGDSITLFIPYLARFDMMPTFQTSSGAKVYVNGQEQTSEQTSVNFVHEQKYKVVSSSGDVRTYRVHIYNSGLPVVYVQTQNNTEIKDTVNWLDNTSVIVYLSDGTVDYDAAPDLAQIRGRGNSTWSIMEDKKPYAIRLNKKNEVLGMLEHKRWVLMANYYDATFIRNELANFLGKKFTNMDWVPSGYSVELVLNGAHKGNYYLCEQVKIDDDRTPGNYLIEADRKAGSGQITGIKTGNYFNIKDPDIATNSEEYTYVKNLLDQFETVLYDENLFLDPTNGYKKYVDLESFVDWLLIKELSKDYDGNMFTSCFAHIMENGIIKMGPIWDFDLAFGGNPFESLMGSWFGTDYAWYNEPDGYHIATSDWFVQMFKDPEFIALLRTKVDRMIQNQNLIVEFIDHNTKMLALSASANTIGYSPSSGMGGMWGGGTQTTTKKTFAEEMEVMKTFVLERLAWMKQDLSSR